MWVSLIGCAKSKPLYTLVEGQSQTANCITENVTLGSIVASGKMLLSGRRKRLSEGYHDETEKQARVVGSGAAKYLKANKLEKQTMLDEFTAATGYHRKYVIRVLKNQRQVQNCLKGKGETCQFAYNGDGQRVKSVINGETIQFVNGYYEKKKQ